MPIPEWTNLTTHATHAPAWAEGKLDLASLSARLAAFPRNDFKYLNDVLAWRRALEATNERYGLALPEEKLYKVCLALAREGGPDEHPHLRVDQLLFNP